MTKKKRPLTAGDLAPSPRNPRTVTESALAELGRSMRELGDVGSIVFNRRTGRLVGGHQRHRNLPPGAPIEVLREFKKPTTAGTLAIGTIEVEGELWSYREVDWPEEREAAANIRANNAAGEWDERMLAEILAEIAAAGGDPSLAGFDQDEVAALIESLSAPPPPDGFAGVDPATLATEHRCPRCGYEWSGESKPETGATEGKGAEA